jgi:hypothetical protein
LLRRAQNNGLLSKVEHELHFKLKYEGFEAKELAEANGLTFAVHRRLHRRLQTIINRLQREAGGHRRSKVKKNGSKAQVNSMQPRKILSQAVNFSGEVPFSNSEKGFSPELFRPVPQIRTDVAQVPA